MSISRPARLRRAASLLLLAVPVLAPAQSDPAACTRIADDAARLQCYDRALGRGPAAAPAPAGSGATTLFRHESAEDAVDSRAAGASLLDSRWELDEAGKKGVFRLRPYKPIYLLPLFYGSRPNQFPSSPAQGRTTTQSRGLQSAEATYQLSFKAKLWEDIFGDNGDLWTGYTQVSHWQVYNDAHSRPFSETNYEPELMLVLRTDYRLLGWHGRLLGFGLDHQSNGQGLPLSRSWNRAILDLGLERDGWALMLRPWWRIHEGNDDNPDIVDYVGRADLRLVREWNGHEFALMGRHTLRGGERSRGAVQFDWAFPISGDLRGHLQLFDGYGQSLIDYNHRAWYFGLGVSLLEWY